MFANMSSGRASVCELAVFYITDSWIITTWSSSFRLRSFKLLWALEHLKLATCCLLSVADMFMLPLLISIPKLLLNLQLLLHLETGRYWSVASLTNEISGWPLPINISLSPLLLLNLLQPLPLPHLYLRHKLKLKPDHDEQWSSVECRWRQTSLIIRSCILWASR